jgi:hypothetical protein
MSLAACVPAVHEVTASATRYAGASRCPRSRPLDIGVTQSI